MDQSRADIVKIPLSGKGDIFLPLFISLIVHGLFLYFLFLGGEKSTAQNSELYAGKKLAMAEDFIVGQSNILTARLTERVANIRSSPQALDTMEWTLETMPQKISAAAKRGGLNLIEIKLTKADENGKEENYNVLMKIHTTSDTVFDDILFASYLVGDGTVHSKFKTEKLVISVKDKGASGVVHFNTYTREARRLYLSKISPQEFLLDATVQEVKEQ